MALAAFTVKAQTQSPAVGKWRSYLPYSEVNGVATDGTTFFCSTTAAFFTYNRTDGSLTGYSKETGMHDIGMSGVAYDPLTQKAILAYTNSNIDLFKDGAFTNIPALKLSQGSGDKTIHSVMADEGEAYLSTGVGLLILNLNKEEVRETIVFYDSTLTGAVYGSTIDNNTVYAATSVGLFKTDKDNPFIQNYLSWTKISPTVFKYITSSNHQIYAGTTDSLYTVSSADVVQFQEKTGYVITHLDPAMSGVWVSTSDTTFSHGYGINIKSDGSHADSFNTVYPTQIVDIGNGDIWYGDAANYSYVQYHGLRKKTSATTSEPYFPAGPITASCFDVDAYNGDLWVAHGGKTSNWGITYNHANFSHYNSGDWSNNAWVGGGEWFQDFLRILKDQQTGNLYVASYSGGLYEQPAGENFKTYTGSDYFSTSEPPGDKVFLVSGLALDADRNLWMTNNEGAKELVVKKADGTWYKMLPIDGNTNKGAADVIVDDYNQKWFISPNGGAIVYNDNNTIENTADDSYRIFKAGEGDAGLPDNNTLSIAKDKDGDIWIGTSDGIAVVSCPGEALNYTCGPIKPIYQDDSFANYLFQGQAVKTIAVDGANRKWIGTSNGIWLISSDGLTILDRFTAENSPLLSNNIERINIDPANGDVYMCTDKGLIAYKGTATDASTATTNDLYIFPNPVPSNFSGMIAIRGFAENSDVRITDIAGQLVYRTKANGGQAVWNGMDYTGHKAQSGVYLVFGVNKDGTKKTSGKFILHR